LGSPSIPSRSKNRSTRCAESPTPPRPKCPRYGSAGGRPARRRAKRLPVSELAAICVLDAGNNGIVLSNVLELTEETFDQETSQPGLTVVDFWDPWCGPCRATAPQIERAAVLRPQYRFAKVDVDENAALASAYGVRAVATLAILRDGELLGTAPGLVRCDELVGALDRVAAPGYATTAWPNDVLSVTKPRGPQGRFRNRRRASSNARAVEAGTRRHRMRARPALEFKSAVDSGASRGRRG
jgi:thioredoxin 1